MGEGDAIPERPQAPVPVGISACLLGRAVRHDGGDKRAALCHEELEGLFEYVEFCPEVAIGLGVPREPLHLVGTSAEEARVVGVRDASRDVTDRLRDYADALVPQLEGLAGYVLMKGSPSCGMERVEIHDRSGNPVAKGAGRFAQRLMERVPTLPLDESGRLHDAVLRENFVTRAFLRAHWLLLQAAGPTPGRLVTFHSRYKYLVMAHSVEACRALGRLLAEAGRWEPESLAATYFARLMEAMRRPATRKSHANVLMHLQGYLKRAIDGESRRELAELIHAYRRGEVSLAVPLTRLRHHLRRHPDLYALDQVYLEPHPPAHGVREAL